MADPRPSPPPSPHLATLLLTALAVLLLIGARWYGHLTFELPLGDESAYTCAWQRAADGASPYTCDRYLYFPLFAHLGGALLGVAPVHTLLVGLRLLNLVAIATLCALAASHTGWSLRAQAATTALAACLAPPFVEAMSFGNVSPLSACLALLAFATWSRAPALPGALLALSVALKPIALVVWLALLLSVHSLRGRVNAAVALVLSAALIGAWPGELQQMLAGPEYHLDAHHNVSLWRTLALVGLPRPAVALLVGATSLTLLLAATRGAWLKALGRGADQGERTEPELMVVACAAALLAFPVIWNHTLALAAPIWAVAIAVALRQWPADASDRDARSRATLEILIVALVALATLHSDTWGALGVMTPALQPLLNAAPLLGLGGLCGYVLWRGAGERAGCDEEGASQVTPPRG